MTTTTTREKIESYLECCEAEDRVPVTHFTEAYDRDEVRSALFAMRREGKVRLVATAQVAAFCEEHGCERADLIEGDLEFFAYVERLAA